MHFSRILPACNLQRKEPWWTGWSFACGCGEGKALVVLCSEGDLVRTGVPPAGETETAFFMSEGLPAAAAAAAISIISRT